MRLYGVGQQKEKSSLIFGSVFGVVLGALLAGALGTSPAQAVDTQIGVSVCGTGAPGAHVDITQPTDDSVVDQATNTFRGNVSNTSQIEVLIDGQYTRTVAVGISQATFAIDLSLTEGTHTVLVKANDICGGQDAEDSIVVTYTPKATLPSSGETTPTSLEGKVTLDGTPVPAEEVNQNDIAKTIEQLPLIGAAVSIVSDFAAAVGLESTVISGNAPAVAGVARVGVTVAALTSVVMASSLAPVAAQAVPGVSEVFNVSSHRSMIYLGWVIRGVGVLAMAFAYFL